MPFHRGKWIQSRHSLLMHMQSGGETFSLLTSPQKSLSLDLDFSSMPHPLHSNDLHINITLTTQITCSNLRKVAFLLGSRTPPPPWLNIHVCTQLNLATATNRPPPPTPGSTQKLLCEDTHTQSQTHTRTHTKQIRSSGDGESGSSWKSKTLILIEHSRTWWYSGDCFVFFSRDLLRKSQRSTGRSRSTGWRPLMYCILCSTFFVMRFTGSSPYFFVHHIH